MADLTALMGMTKGNLTYHIDQLEASGWVRREPSATDRRVTELTLTDQGRAILQRVSEEFKGRFERLGSQVSATEMVMMNAGLELLLARSELLMDVEAPDA
jgi:MarR family 2-MHQ and catechol resistance regulon transcriptional repressor